jgi:rhodanese-related sulfurtransferase
VLLRATMSHSARAFIGWFGPRGLNSLLLALLVVQAGAPDAERLLAITGMVVLVSVFAHGASATPLSSWYGRRVARAQLTLAEEREGTATGLFERDATDFTRITPRELAARLSGPEPPVVLDVRTRGQYHNDPGQIPGSVRVLPDHVEEWVAKASRARSVVAYCTWPSEATSARVARQLKSLGFDAAALLGGYNAWQALYPVEPKEEQVPAWYTEWPRKLSVFRKRL